MRTQFYAACFAYSAANAATPNTLSQIEPIFISLVREGKASEWYPDAVDRFQNGGFGGIRDNRTSCLRAITKHIEELTSLLRS